MDAIDYTSCKRVTIINSIIIKFIQPSAVPWMSRKSTEERFPALGKTEDTWRGRVMIGVNEGEL